MEKDIPLRKDNLDWNLTMDEDGIFKLYDLMNDTSVAIDIGDIDSLKEIIRKVEIYSHAFHQLKKIGL